MWKEISNDFSWSKSRHEKLSECLRAYYYHYYRSWGGWSDEASREARELYVLKKLGNRFTWAGSVVHDSIRTVLWDIRANRPVDAASVIQRAHQQMRDDYLHSSRKFYRFERNRRDFWGLIEHEYGEPVSKEQWKSNWEQAKAALEWFLKSRWIQVARGLRPEQWLEVDDRSFEESAFQLAGVRVFAIPDFAFIDSNGVPVVVDWKTGKSREGYEEQVLGYALYLSSRYGLPVESIRASLVYLNDGLERVVQVDRDSVAGFQQHFERSVAKMRALLEDPSQNLPKPEAVFQMTDNPSICSRCPFRRPCGKVGGSVQKVA
jgi:CRISPR/Cas system-associated exonuclease Cas4 (RecB family)